MAKHRTFSEERFLDKLKDNEALIQNFVKLWEGFLDLKIDSLDVPGFKEFLVHGEGDKKDELLEELYRAYDLCTDYGQEQLINECQKRGYDPDPEGDLPGECISLKVRTEHEEAFNSAYDLNTLWQAEGFVIFQGKEARAIPNTSKGIKHFKEELSNYFKNSKKSEHILIRHFEKDSCLSLIIYHAKRTKAEIVFEDIGEVSRLIMRPVQQDFINYYPETGAVEIKARFKKEQTVLRKAFASHCIGDESFFENEESGERINLAKVAQEDFSMPVDPGHIATMVYLKFRLNQVHAPSFEIRSEDLLETLNFNNFRAKLKASTIEKVAFKITFPDDRRGKRIELSGKNKMKFKRKTYADKILNYLKNWGLLRG